MKTFKIFLFLLLLSSNIFSKELIDINFQNLSLDELIKISSKLLNKDILLTHTIEGSVDFTSNKKLRKDDLMQILELSLKEKGYFLKEQGEFLKVEKIAQIEKKPIHTKIINLKNIEGQNLQKILDEIITKKNYEEGAQKAIISLEAESNSLVLMATEDEIDFILSIIDELDKEKAQVYVQARIIELNDELLEKIGVSYGIFGGHVGNHSLSTFSSSLNGGSDSLSIVKNVIGLKIPDLTSGLALGASLNLLKQNGALNIVSEPSILAINNKESYIYVGEKISVQTSSSVSDGGTQRTNYQREDVGLTLKVKPRISSDTKVTLEINTLLEGIKSTSVGAGENPDTLKKEIKTTAILNNGESVIIGGLIENKNEIIEQKVPVLGDIPLVGTLFKNEANLNKKNNLVVIVTPYMIPESKDITYVRNELSQLKNLEDKFLQDSLLRIKEDSLKQKLENQDREQKLAKLDNEIKNTEKKKKVVIKEENIDSKTLHERKVDEFYNRVNQQ